MSQDIRFHRHELPTARKLNQLVKPRRLEPVYSGDSTIVELQADIAKDATGNVKWASYYSGAWHTIGASFAAMNIGAGDAKNGDHVHLWPGGATGATPYFRRYATAAITYNIRVETLPGFNDGYITVNYAAGTGTGTVGTPPVWDVQCLWDAGAGEWAFGVLLDMWTWHMTGWPGPPFPAPKHDDPAALWNIAGGGEGIFKGPASAPYSYIYVQKL